jgi:membrane-associated phospholipid phosphatase
MTASEPRPVDRLLGIYALASGAALLFPHRPATWPILALLHLGVAAFALGPGIFARCTRAFHCRFPALANWLPLLLVPALYLELAILNRAVHDGHYFDAIVQAWEQTIFGTQPSIALSDRLPFLPLSEVLHTAYISYYAIIYVPPLLLWFAGRHEEFRRGVFTLMLAFFAHYVFFIYFPVQGPRYLFPAPDGVIAGGPVYGFAHRVLEAGSARGAAFPSSHVGVAVAQALFMTRAIPPLAPVVAILAAGLALGAVYGTFHYAIDVLAGFALGAVAAAAAPSLRRRLGAVRGARSRPRPGSSIGTGLH